MNNNIDIREYLLQRPPILMVDSLHEVSEKEAVTGLTITQDCFFVDETGECCESGVVEHIAQSASVLMGWNARQKGEDAVMGYIGEVKKCAFAFLPKAGDTLRTRIRFLSEAMGVTLAEAETTVNGNLLTSCKLKISI